MNHGIFDPRQQDQPQPGEWQTETNRFGGTRRFRMVGHVKEYEPTVTIDGIEVPQSDLEDFHRRRKEQAEQRIAADRQRAAERAAKETGRTCPFKLGEHVLDTTCTRECPFFGDTSCIFATAPTQPTADTQGRYCPIAKRCNPSCAMYAGGCKIIEFVKGLKPGKE